MLVTLFASLASLSSPVLVVTAGEEARLLSVQLGRPVALSRELTKDLVFVETHGRTPSSALQAFAAALSASTKASEAGWIIQRTESNRRDIEKQRLAERSKWIRARIRQLSDYRIARFPSGTSLRDVHEEDRRLREARSNIASGSEPPLTDCNTTDALPAEVLLERLVMRIGVERMASLPSGHFAVYEDRPVSGAEPLPSHGDLDNLYIKSMLPFREAQPPVPPGQTHPSDFYLDWSMPTRPLDRLRVSQASLENGIYVKLEAYDSFGHRMMFALFRANRAAQRTPESMLLGELPPAAHWVGVPPQVALAAKFCREGGDGHFPAWFIQPGRFDPLNVVAASALNALADAAPGKCVAVDVSDDWYTLVPRCIVGNRLNLHVLREIFDQWAPYQFIEGNDSLIGRPYDPIYAEESRADRSALGRFAVEFSQFGHSDLRSTAEMFYHAASGISPLALDWDYRARLTSGVWHEPGTITTYGYRLLGAIPEGDWTQLLSGHPKTVGQLGVSRETEELLSSDWALKVDAPPGTADIFLHPHELLPGGGLGDAILTVLDNQVPVMRIWKERSLEPSLWGSAAQLQHHANAFAFFEMQRVAGTVGGHPNRERFEKNLANYRFRRGRRQDIIATLHLPMNCSITMRGPSFAIGDPDTMAFSDLPKESQDRIWNEACANASRRLTVPSSSSTPSPLNPVPPP